MQESKSIGAKGFTAVMGLAGSGSAPTQSVRSEGKGVPLCRNDFEQGQAESNSATICNAEHVERRNMGTSESFQDNEPLRRNILRLYNFIQYPITGSNRRKWRSGTGG